MMRTDGLKTLLTPQSIVVVGASEDQRKPGGRIVRNILKQEYKGRLFLINPKAAKIQGRPALRSIGWLPETPDLALIAIPAGLVEPAMVELLDLGVKNIVVLSAGFGEVDEKGKEIEARLAKMADEKGALLLGPNCLGVMSPVFAGKFAGLLPQMKTGGIDFISGSGATVDYLIEQADKRGLAFHTFVTVGNSAQTGVTDMLALYDQHLDELNPKQIMLYLEHIGDPEKFLESAGNLTRRGCILMGIKSGVTEAGVRAAASHTGAMAAADTAVQALFEKAGVIRVESRLEMVDLASVVVLAKGKYDGRRVAVITDAGGPGVMLADELNRHGLSVPQFKDSTKALLGEILSPGASPGNPVDCLPSRTGEQITRIIDVVCREEGENLDYIILVAGDSGLADNWEIYQAAAQAMDEAPLPIFPSFCTAVSSARALEKFRALDKCYFEDEVSLARALGRMVNRPRPAAQAAAPRDYDAMRVRELLKNAKGLVSPDLAVRVLSAAGVPCPAQVEVHDASELENALKSTEFPWVMKVMGVVHKSDSGGVILGVETPEQARAAWENLTSIKGAQGVLVQHQVKGAEVIMGASREGDFGSLVVFGLGGIFAEALKDVRFGLAPLSHDEALGMISGIRGRRILEGMRGKPGMDQDVLADLLVRVSWLANDIPRLKEMDLNPLMGEGKNILAVDVRLIMED